MTDVECPKTQQLIFNKKTIKIKTINIKNNKNKNNKNNKND